MFQVVVESDAIKAQSQGQVPQVASVGPSCGQQLVASSETPKTNSNTLASGHFTLTDAQQQSLIGQLILVI